MPDALLIALCRKTQREHSCTPSCCRHNRPGDDPVRENVCACMRARARLKEECQDNLDAFIHGGLSVLRATLLLCQSRVVLRACVSL